MKSYIPAQLDGLKKGGYIPAKMESIFDNINYNSKKLSWWEDESFFFYPRLLVSAYYGMKYPNFREHFHVKDDVALMLDSGGFQNLTLNANLDPIKVLRWQEANGNIGLTFDLPTLKDDTKEVKIRKQLQTVENAYLALDSKQNEKLRLYAVTQGHTFDEQQFIIDKYNEIGDIKRFDGFAMGGIVSIKGDIKFLTNAATVFVNNLYKYKKPLHFLGLSGLNSVPVILYLMNKFDVTTTYDSTSYAVSAKINSFVNPFTLRKDEIPMGELGNKLLKEIPCSCPVCSNIEGIHEFYDRRSVSSALISLHNLWYYIKYDEMLRSLIDDDELFKSFIYRNNSLELKECFQYIDYACAEGIVKANQKFNFTNSYVETQKNNKSLFGKWQDEK